MPIRIIDTVVCSKSKLRWEITLEESLKVAHGGPKLCLR